MTTMSDDALTRKEAEMGRLTREKVERLRLALKLLADYDNSVNEDEVDALCNQALSLESVREEVLAQGDKLMQAKRSGYDEGCWMGLEAAAKMCEVLIPKDAGSQFGQWRDEYNHYESCARHIRALQHAPARVAEGGATPKEKS